MAAMTLPMVPPASGVRQIRPSRTHKIIGAGYDPDLTPVQPEWTRCHPGSVDARDRGRRGGSDPVKQRRHAASAEECSRRKLARDFRWRMIANGMGPHSMGGLEDPIICLWKDQPANGLNAPQNGTSSGSSPSATGLRPRPVPLKMAPWQGRTRDRG